MSFTFFVQESLFWQILFFCGRKPLMLCLEALNILWPRRIGGILLVFVMKLFIQILRCFFWKKC